MRARKWTTTQEHTMSSQTQPAPRRRRYGWWIAAGIIFAVLVALLTAAWFKFAEPARLVLGVMSWNPVFPGCTSTVAEEGTVGPVWYRIVNVGCSNGASMHLVFAKRGGIFVYPAFFSDDDSAIPVSVRQTGDRAFEVVLAKPLADGRTSVPFVFEQNGVINDMQRVEHGKPGKTKINPFS
jgi:hypothetical protein